jgi:hypothetical protein
MSLVIYRNQKDDSTYSMFKLYKIEFIKMTPTI